MTELQRQDRWQSVFFTLKDPSDGACLRVTMGRGRFDALKLELENGRRVHVFGRPELFEAKGDFSLRALSIERFGLGDHLAALERLKAKLAAEGLFAPERKRPLPALPAPRSARDRERRRRQARRAHRDPDPLPARPRAGRRDVRAGPVRGRRDDRRARGAVPRRRPRRDRARPRRRELRGPAARSATSGSCARWRPAPCRSSRRSATSRTRRSATSPPTSARPRRAWPRGSSCPTRPSCVERLDRARERLALGAAAADRPSAARGAARLETSATSACRARRPSARRSSASGAQARARGRAPASARAARDARARLRDRPLRRDDPPRRQPASTPATASRSSSPRAASARASRT